MEEAEVDLKTPHDLASQVEAAMEAQKTGKVSRRKINTKNILFIVSGAFNELDKIINRRMNRQAIGFNKERASEKDKQDVLKQVRTEDLIEFGFESEFVGRLPVYVVLNSLDIEGLFKILKNEYSTVVIGKKLDFKAYGINLEFSDDALRTMAERAHREKTGARGLLSVFEKLLISFEKKLPSTSVKELKVDSALIENPESVLKDIVIKDSIERYQKEFLIEHGIFLDFEQKAVERLAEMAEKEEMGIKELCDNRFHDYFHGIRLLKLESFTVTEEAVKDPDAFMDNYIKTNYKK
jgi:ATP-dependent protease Clp ATPase subunit